MVEMTEQEESSSRGQSSFYDHHDDSYVLSRDHLGVVRYVDGSAVDVPLDE